MHAQVAFVNPAKMIYFEPSRFFSFLSRYVCVLVYIAVSSQGFFVADQILLQLFPSRFGTKLRQNFGRLEKMLEPFLFLGYIGFYVGFA